MGTARTLGVCSPLNFSEGAVGFAHPVGCRDPFTGCFEEGSSSDG